MVILNPLGVFYIHITNNLFHERRKSITILSYLLVESLLNVQSDCPTCTDDSSRPLHPQPTGKYELPIISHALKLKDY